MEIQQIKINQLIEYKNNAKKHDEAQIKNVMESIKEFGMVQPIVVDKNNVIIIGHCRFKALQKLNWQEVPALRLEDLTESEVNKLRLLDNKLNESEWDFDLLSDQIGAIDWNNFDIDWGLDDFLKEDEKLEIIEDEAPDVEDTSISQVGDIYILGKHRLICGDSTDVTVIERLMDGVKVDMVFTDSPYGVNIVNDKGKVGADNLAKNGVYAPVIGDDTTETAQQAYDIYSQLCDKMILWGGNYFLDFLPASDGWLIWDKRGDSGIRNNFADGEMAWCSFHTPVRIYHQLWNGMIREGEHEKRVHPTQKPIRMLSEILKDFTKESDIILDVFGGSGSTLIACEQLNRRCFMCELSPNYIDVIVKRYIDFTNNKNDVYVIRDGQKIKYKDLKT